VIDEILADFQTRPEVWAAAWTTHSEWAAQSATQSDELRSAAWFATWRARVAAQNEARDAADAAWIAGRDAGRDAILALVIWDTSADLLALTPDALRTIIDTCEGDMKHQAVLLLPAVIARSTP